MTNRHRPNKSLGQNFLVDQRIQQKIVDACHLSGQETVIEIGPGQAAITSRVLPLVKRLIAVEKDRQLADLLRTKYQDERFEVISGDFLLWDMDHLPDDLVIIGNIPYYISTPIIEKLLAFRHKIKRAYLTVQLEFGQRMAASPGNKAYGSLSCFVQYHADVKLLFKISPGSFHPKPKVDSCFISLVMKEMAPRAKDETFLFKMVQTVFTQRRKIISNGLKDFGDAERINQVLKELGIDPQRRPEELTLLNYIELSDRLML